MHILKDEQDYVCWLNDCYDLSLISAEEGKIFIEECKPQSYPCVAYSPSNHFPNDEYNPIYITRDKLEVWQKLMQQVKDS